MGRFAGYKALQKFSVMKHVKAVSSITLVTATAKKFSTIVMFYRVNENTNQPYNNKTHINVIDEDG